MDPQQAPQQSTPPGMYPNRPTPPPPPPPPQQYQSASQMKQHGKHSTLIIIVLVVLLLGSIGFGVWAFLERSEYKNNVDGIVATEVEQAVNQREQELEAEFIEREKEPLDSYTGPSAFGSVRLEYPKTWSAYIQESDSGSTPIEGYFHPGFVPDESDNVIALKLEVIDRSYERELSSYESAARSDRVTIEPIEAANLDGVVGSRVDGEIESDVQGSVVLFSLRDKTLVLTAQSTEYLEDFNDIILPNLTFNP